MSYDFTPFPSTGFSSFSSFSPFCSPFSPWHIYNCNILNSQTFYVLGAREIFKSTGVDGGKAFVGPDAELYYLNILNEVQVYIDGKKINL